MKKNIFFLVGVALLQVSPIHGQKVSEVIDELTYAWDVEAEKLSAYEGLTEFCNNNEYRYKTIDLLREIHHYDSLLYKKLLNARRRSKNTREVERTLKDIEEFEAKYTTENFIHFLHGDCNESKDLERNSKDLRRDFGVGSYDNRIYVLEVELGRYVHHITKKIDQIREHVHHLYN